jgi:hypothetical protein
MRTPLPLIAALLFAGPACAGAASQALEESGEAVAAGLGVGAKTVSAVAAVPITGVGLASTAVGSVADATGALAGEVGEETIEAGSAAAEFASEPLVVDDAIVLAPMPAPKVPYDAQDEL